MGTFTINSSEYINQPPDEVGTFEIELNSGDSYPFRASNFTTDTTPQAHDPEGDDFDAIKIFSIGDDITLQVNGSDVQENDIVLLSDIDAGDLVVTLEADTSTGFSFYLRDVGSGEFSSDTGSIIISTPD